MNIFLIEIRGCHVGYLGCYGNDWLRTPALDTIAGSALVFDAHYADVVGAGGRQVAWAAVKQNDRIISLESCISDQHGEVQWFGSWSGITRRPLDEVNPALRHMVSRESCLMAIGINDLMPPWSSQGTTETLEQEVHPDDIDAEAQILNEREAAIVSVREAYAKRVERVDQWLGTFLEQLEDKKLLDRAAIVITSDQGMSLGEHAPAGTMPTLPYEEIRHLPLIIHLPGDVGAGSRVSSFTQASNLRQLILELLGGAHAVKTEYNLLSLCRDDKNTGGYARTVQVSESGSQTVAIRTREWAFLTGLSSGSADAELYCKPDDRWEINNVVQHHADVVPRLENLARALPGR